MEIGRVSILILNYNSEDKINPSKLVLDAYDSLCNYLNQKYLIPSNSGIDMIVLANNKLVAKHQKDFENRGLTFFPNWENSLEYAKLLREGMRQGTDIYLMRNINEQLSHQNSNRYSMDLVNILDNSQIEI